MVKHQPCVLTWLAVCLVLAGVAAAADGPPVPGPKDRCSTCGMFVAKYPSWVATIVYEDGSRRFFDGPKDLFRFRSNQEPSTVQEVEVWVTDYYTTKPMNARDAFFVCGSDVLGPMGAELIPLASVELAESFRTDHGGEAILVFNDVDADVLRSLE